MAGRCPSTGDAGRLKIVDPVQPCSHAVPHACGLAWAIRVNKEPGVVWVSFGDGVASKGDFHEGLNFAGIHKLPVIFFCENNSTRSRFRSPKQSPVERVSDRAAAYGMPGVSVDGNDVFEVYQASAGGRRAGTGGGRSYVDRGQDLPHCTAHQQRRRPALPLPR